MSDPWDDGTPEPLFGVPDCRCFGRLGCAHGLVGRPDALVPSRSDWLARLAEVSGLDLDVCGWSQAGLVLPSVVPFIERGFVVAGRERAAVAISLSTLMRDWKMRRPTALSLRDRYGLPPATKVILVLFARDDRLELLWERRDQFLQGLRVLEPDLVLAPSFSVWASDPWTEQRYAIKRSAHFFGLIQDAGIAAIPHVYWGRKVDAEDWVSWLNRNQSVDRIAIDGGSLAGSIGQWTRQLAWIRERLLRPTELLLSGVASGAQLRAAQAAWGELVVLHNGVRRAASYRGASPQADGSVRRVRVRDESGDDLWPSLRVAGPVRPQDLYGADIAAIESALTSHSAAGRP